MGNLMHLQQGMSPSLQQYRPALQSGQDKGLQQDSPGLPMSILKVESVSIKEALNKCLTTIFR